jgi:hypothetical protein
MILTKYVACNFGPSFLYICFVNLEIVRQTPCSSAALKEDHRLRAFKDRVLRRIFGINRAEVTRNWNSRG